MINQLDDIPDIFSGVAELAACNTSTEAVVADGNCFILEFIGEVITTFGHGSHKDTDAFLRTKGADIFVDSNNRRFKTQSDLAAIGW